MEDQYRNVERAVEGAENVRGAALGMLVGTFLFAGAPLAGKNLPSVILAACGVSLFAGLFLLSGVLVCRLASTAGRTLVVAGMWGTLAGWVAMPVFALLDLEIALPVVELGRTACLSVAMVGLKLATEQTESQRPAKMFLGVAVLVGLSGAVQAMGFVVSRHYRANALGDTYGAAFAVATLALRVPMWILLRRGMADWATDLRALAQRAFRESLAARQVAKA